MLSWFMDKHIYIQLDRGVYMFQPESSTGKTYLFGLLRRLWLAGEPVATYTWTDEKMHANIYEVVKPGEQKVLMLDRYDLYSDKYWDLIQEFAKTGIVLLDCKGLIELWCNPCKITLYADRIEVY